MAQVLTERRLAAATDERRFDHGADYVRYVHGLRIASDSAAATIQAKRVYRVTLSWGSRRLEGDCTCPDRDQGFFCKHLVAVGLMVLDEQRGPVPTDALNNFVEGLDRAELIDLLRQLLDRDQDARNVVLARAAAVGQTAALDPQHFVTQINEALTTRGFVDYRRSFDYAREVELALDPLEELLDLGAADAVAPALLRATTRLRKVILHADDSGGAIGSVGQRAAELYARACREGHPDAAAVARWLVTFRRDSPGWPQLTLADFAGVFDNDDKALATYRRAVQKWSDEIPGADQWERFEVDRALVELADHDQDLDKAIELLSGDPDRTPYGEIVERLLAADRLSDAVGWLDRAVAAHRVSSRHGRDPNTYWLHPRRSAEVYLRVGRVDDAVAAVRAGFSTAPNVDSWRLLLEIGRAVGAEAEQREWGLSEAERLAGQPFGNGASLIEIALAEDRLDDAWMAAKRFGPGHAWEALAKASEQRRPTDAAQLYRPKIEELLRFATTKNYAPAAAMLKIMKTLMSVAGEETSFETYLADLRGRYGNRPSLMGELARKGLTSANGDIAGRPARR